MFDDISDEQMAVVMETLCAKTFRLLLNEYLRKWWDPDASLLAVTLANVDDNRLLVMTGEHFTFAYSWIFIHPGCWLVSISFHIFNYFFFAVRTVRTWEALNPANLCCANIANCARSWRVYRDTDRLWLIARVASLDQAESLDKNPST